MPFLELFDETLDINSTENYELSVQVSRDELSFCILDTLRKKFVLLRSYETEEDSRFDPVKIGEIINKDDFLIRHFKKVNIITPTPGLTLVPAPLFDESKKDDYFKFNQIYSDGNSIVTNRLRDPDVFIIFSLPDGIAEILRTAFPGCIIMHHLNPIFQYINYNRRSLGSNNVHINLEKDYLNMVIFDQNSLKFCNTFQYGTISDIQYYVLYILKKMNIRQEEGINFSGIAARKEEIIRSFSGYLNLIKFPVPSGNYTFSYVFNENELYKFLVLFSSVSCE